MTHPFLPSARSRAKIAASHDIPIQHGFGQLPQRVASSLSWS
jgi:hypothetical protein